MLLAIARPCRQAFLTDSSKNSRGNRTQALFDTALLQGLPENRLFWLASKRIAQVSYTMKRQPLHSENSKRFPQVWKQSLVKLASCGKRCRTFRRGKRERTRGQTRAFDDRIKVSAVPDASKKAFIASRRDQPRPRRSGSDYPERRVWGAFFQAGIAAFTGTISATGRPLRYTRMVSPPSTEAAVGPEHHDDAGRALRSNKALA